MSFIFEKDGVFVQRQVIEQGPGFSDKVKLFVSYDGYDAGVYDEQQMTQAIDEAVNLANMPKEERLEWVRGY